MARGVLATSLVVLLALPVAAGAAGFDDPESPDTSQQFTPSGHVQRQDTPNDPDYDRAEDPGPTTTNLYDQRFDLFGFPSKHTPLAIYKDGPNGPLKPMVAGFNAAGAWKATRGNPRVAVAILDTGVRWERAGLRTQVRLNRAELPPPQDATGATLAYDANGNGVLDVDDYAADPRVGKARPTGQDLIRAFSNGVDEDGNGYTDDIAGWDFHDDDNDPFDSSSYFAARNHGSGRAQEAVERGDDGEGSIGVCPRCQFLPLRIWDTFVSDANTFALATLYAADMGIQVIEGANGSLYHSAFAEQASEYAYHRGAAQVFSGNDLNTGNHNYPANYSHTMLIQGTVADTYGLGTDLGPEAAAMLSRIGAPLGSQIPTLTLFRGAGTTQYGGHSSVSMVGATGSENTGKAAGAAALVISAALERDPPVRLTPDETRIILEQTAEDVTPLNTVGIGLPDRAVEGWDPHFGWGRVDLGKAVSVAKNGKLPPEAAIWSPDWFAPLTDDTVRITGRARARHSVDGAFRWKLEWGAGQTPIRWHVAGQGAGKGEVTDFGSIDLAAVRAELARHRTPFDAGAPLFGPGGPTPFDREVTVRLTVAADGVQTRGVDRRVLNALADSTLLAGYPKRLGTGGEAPPRYADVDGDGEQELVVPLMDGTIHAYRRDGSEPKGWPLKTDLMLQAANHPKAPGIAAVGTVAPPREPPRGVVIADLEGDGETDIITAAGRHVYAWTADGRRKPGFPAGIDPALCRGEDQIQPLRHRKCGFMAPPALARLAGRNAPPAIVAPALDGHLYAFRHDGRRVPGYPLELVDPRIAPAERMLAESINAPAVGDLDGDGHDDVVVATNETYGAREPGGDSIRGLLAQALTDLLASAAGGSSRVYAVSGATGKYLPGWPIAVNGAIQTTLPLIGPGHDPAIATIGGRRLVVVSTTGSTGIELRAADGSLVRTMQQGLFGPLSDATDRIGVLNLFESAVVGDVLGAGLPAVVKYGVTLSQAANLLLVGQNLPYNHLIGAHDAATGLPLPAFPRITDDYQFLSASTIAKVDPGSPANQVIAGNALGMLHAYDGLTGRDAPGFPKTTGGWMFAPAALSDDGRIAAITREGFLFQWRTAAPRCQPAGTWPAFRHDEAGSGNLDADGTRPGVPTGITLEWIGADRWRLRFTSPGDDGRCGKPAAYEAQVGKLAVDLGDGAPAAAGEQVERTVTLPERGTLVLLARDEAGNRGPAARVGFVRPRGPRGPAEPAGRDGGTAGDHRSSCNDLRPPVSRFTARRIGRSGLTLAGRSRDRGCDGRIRRVMVAIDRVGRDGRCRPMRPSGRLGRPRACRRPVYMRAVGRASWRLRIERRPTRGRYVARVRAIDGAGNREQPRRSGKARFRVR